MGFGSYDESEQETDDNREGPDGEDWTEEFHQADHDGEDSVANTTEELIDHL